MEQLYSWCAPLRNIIRVFVTAPGGLCLGEASQDYGKRWNEFFMNKENPSPGLHRAGRMEGSWTVKVQIASVLTESLDFDLELSMPEKATTAITSKHILSYSTDFPG